MTTWFSCLYRSAPLCGCVLTVGIAALREGDGSPRWELHWQPARPARLTPDDMRLVDEFRRRVQVELLGELAKLQEGMR